MANFAKAWICNCLILCDKGYCFFSRKVRMVKLVSVNEDFVSEMTLLGEEDETSAAVRETLERLVCSLYQVKLEINVNETIYKFFTKKKKQPPPQSFQPTNIDTPSKTDTDGPLDAQWGYLKPAPNSILEFFSCSCKKSECATNHCSCAAVNLPCADLCCCTNCKNNDSSEIVDVNEIFNDNDDFGEYQDGNTDGEADDSNDSSEDEFFEDDEIDND